MDPVGKCPLCSSDFVAWDEISVGNDVVLYSCPNCHAVFTEPSFIEE